MRIVGKPIEWVIKCYCCNHTLAYDCNDIINDCGSKVVECCHCHNTIYVPIERERELLEDSPYKDS